MKATKTTETKGETMNTATAYSEGFAAFNSNHTGRNPYRDYSNSMEAAWQAGWDAAARRSE